MRLSLFAFLFILVLTSCSKTKIGSRHIRASERLAGIEFSGKERKTMAGYLNGNRKGYDTMRATPLPHTVTPALYFDPRPQNFAFKKIDHASDWKLPEVTTLPATDEELAFLPVAHLGSLIRQHKLTSVRLTRVYLDRMKKFKDTLQCIVTITDSLALAQAARADEEIARGRYRGPLHGIPYGIKDLFSVPSYTTTWGAEPYQNQMLSDTSEVVRRLEQAGAVLIAKLTSGALARGDVWFGGRTRNPWDLKQGASGSSAGSASATSAGLVAFSIGTETLGSILAPSTRCGATGLRPTFGAVSRAGAMTLSWSMDKAGPICRTAQDCALVFEAIHGRHPQREKDRSVVDYAFAFAPPADLKGYRIGYTKKLFDKDTTERGANHAAMLQQLNVLGADLKEMTLPDKVPYDVFDIILRAEAGAFFDELVRTHRDRELLEQSEDSRANSLRQSRFIPAVEYLQANRHRTVLIERFHTLMKNYDFIVVPMEGDNQLMLTNLTGNPAISIPTGLDKKGHPTSVVLIGNLYDEGPLLEAAFLFQQATTHEEQHPALFLNR